MLGFKLNEGTHSIRINYKALMLNEGKILSIVGFIIFVIVLLYDRKGSKNEKDINDSTLF